ncbi:MAG: hypothetical protein JWM57_722 [Phycisphaerales bacterium]|nr:hypothetical protein [Phycisphaerales bacterium]
MSDLKCAVCGATCMQPGAVCGQCHASPEWQDLFRASQIAGEQYADLHAQDLLSATDYQCLTETLTATRLHWSEQMRQGLQPPAGSGLRSRSHCRQCERPARAEQKFCATCGGPTGARADRLRYLDFAIHFLGSRRFGGMAASTCEQCAKALSTRLEAMEAELKREGAAESVPEAARHEPGRRNLFEILLDPQSIRWLLGSGGVLLAVGLVIFLSSLGVFKNAMVVASAMGAGTLAMLAGGIAMIRWTRHSLPGRAMALLGCLVMPLNLWFYNANHLVTLDGHLWVAAMVCCVLYGIAAFVLEDPLFVYVLFGGIAMTGMLALADLHRVVEISAPATLLVTLGLISLHAERAFADDEGPFSRKRFGLACFWSAHGMIGLGLILLLGSQIATWMPNFGYGLHHIAALPSNAYLALALVLAGGYACVYSSLVVRRSAIYGYLAGACLLWAELLGVQIAHLTNHLPVLLSTLALTSLAMNIAASLLSKNTADHRQPLAGPFAFLGIGVMTIAVAMGVIPQARTVLPGVPAILNFSVTWNYVGVIALAAVSCRIAASLNARTGEGLSVAYHFAAAVATFTGAAGLLTLIGLNTWPAEATVLMAVPMIYLLASIFHKDGPAKRALPIIAGASATVLTFSSLIASGSQWISPMAGQATDLWLAAFALEGAVFFAISAATSRGKFNVYFAAAMVCGMIYQLLGFWALPLQSYNIAIAVAGVAGLIAYRFVGAESRGKDDKANALFVCANALVSLPMVAVMLMSLSRLAVGHMDLSMLPTPAILSGIALIAALTSAKGTRRWYLALTISQVALSLLALAHYSTLSLPRKLEMLSVIAGLGLLVAGYVVWYREQNGKSDGVGFCLLTGALMAGLPPAMFAIVNRFGFQVSFVDELALITIAVLMFLTGLMSRVRATTLIGGGLLTCHLVILVVSVFVGMKEQLAVGAYVAIGGAALFGIGLVLSVYRDRLLEMPQRIKYRQGLFRVLAWT